MTLEEFNNCKVGDRVLSSTGKVSKIKDIDRIAGTITIGSGKWRPYHIIKLPTLEIVRSRLKNTSSETISLSRESLERYGFPRTLIMQTIENAGFSGFVGSSRDISQCAEFISEEYTRNLIAAMCRENLISRKLLCRGIYCFTLVK